MIKDLIFFQSNHSSHTADYGEKVGNIGTGWLILGFGKKISVLKINEKEISFQESTIPLYQRIIAVVSAVGLLPFSLVFFAIGCAGYACSKTYADIKAEYNRSIKSRVNDLITPLLDNCNIREFDQNNDYLSKKWLTNKELTIYTLDYIRKTNRDNEIFYISSDSIESGIDYINYWDINERPLPKKLTYFPLVGENHFVLIYICTITGTIEYYDSKKNYENDAVLTENLGKLIAELEKKDNKKYKVIFKIKKLLQKNAYDCGPWVLYFFEQKLLNSDVDFNTLDINEAQEMIKTFRLQIMYQLIEIHQNNQLKN